MYREDAAKLESICWKFEKRKIVYREDVVKLEFICQKLASSKVEDREDMPITRIYLSEIQMEGLDEVINPNSENRYKNCLLPN